MDADNSFPAGLRVLAVDDDRVCLKILERQLKRCNYDATVVTDAGAALNMLMERKDGNNQFDVVISDVVMPNMDGFKLLELIGLEMDLPVIMLSANNETQTIIKGIKHGACDYMVKPVCLEQLRGIWTHVVKKNGPQNSTSNGSDDDVVQKLPSRDTDKSDKVGENSRNKNSKKNKKTVGVTDEDNEATLAQKKQRVQWCGQLHRKFVEAVRQIGIDRAIPKKILEIMNVEGLTRENVASHLQKYRIYLRKLSEGTLRNSNPFVEETEALRRSMNIPSFIRSPSSSNHFPKTNSSTPIGTQTFMSTQSVPTMSSQKNFGIPRSNMELVGHGVNLSKDVIPMPMPVEDISRFISSGKSYAPILSGGLPGASQCFPSSSSSSSYGNMSTGVVLNASKPFSIDIHGSSNDSPPLTSNMCFSSSRSCSSYASILRGKILGSSRGIPFEDIADGEMLDPSSHLPLQTPELVNQPSVQLQSCSASQIVGPGPSRFSNLGHNVGLSKDPSQGNIFKINQLSRLARPSEHIPTIENEYQKKMAGIMGKVVPVVGFREQVALFNFGDETHSPMMSISNSTLNGSSSIGHDFQMDNSTMLTQVLNGGGATNNLHEGSTTNQQVVSDQVNNINEFLIGTSEAQNAESDDLDVFLANLSNQDLVNNDDSFIDRDWEFAP